MSEKGKPFYGLNQFYFLLQYFLIHSESKQTSFHCHFPRQIEIENFTLYCKRSLYQLRKTTRDRSPWLRKKPKPFFIFRADTVCYETETTWKFAPSSSNSQTRQLMFDRLGNTCKQRQGMFGKPCDLDRSSLGVIHSKVFALQNVSFLRYQTRYICSTENKNGQKQRNFILLLLNNHVCLFSEFARSHDLSFITRARAVMNNQRAKIDSLKIKQWSSQPISSQFRPLFYQHCHGGLAVKLAAFELNRTALSLPSFNLNCASSVGASAPMPAVFQFLFFNVFFFDLFLLLFFSSIKVKFGNKAERYFL